MADERILNLDLQVIVNKLSKISTAQVSRETLISDDADVNTKEFLSFIVKLIDAAKETESVSVDNNIEKLNRLIKDSNEVLSKFFSNNSLIQYYEDTLSEKLNDIVSTPEGETGEVDVNSIKSSIIDVLKTLNASVDAQRQETFNTVASDFKKEFIAEFQHSIALKAENIKETIDKTIESEVQNVVTKLAPDITNTINSLLCQNTKEYVKSLNKTFDDNFKRFIERNFTNRVKQIELTYRVRRFFGSILTPFTLLYKQIKYVKEHQNTLPQTGQGGGTQQKRKWYDKVLNPFRNFKNNMTERYENMRRGFLERTRFIRSPARFLKLKFGKMRRTLNKSDKFSVLKKYGPLGLLAKVLVDAYRRKYKNAVLVGQMDFKPFKFLSAITNSLDEFIESVDSHVKIIANNLKIFFDKTVVEGYNVRNKLGFGKGKRKQVKEEEKKKEQQGGLLDFLLSLPMIFRTLKRIWSTLKKTWQFIKNVGLFLKRLSLNIFARGAKILGRIFMLLTKRNSRLWNLGRRLVDWGDSTIDALKAGKSAAQTAKRIEQTLDATEAAIKGAKTTDELVDAGKTLAKLTKEIDNLDDQITILRNSGKLSEAKRLEELKLLLKNRKYALEAQQAAAAARMRKLGSTETFLVSHGDEVVDAAGKMKFTDRISDFWKGIRKGAGSIITRILNIKGLGKILQGGGKILGGVGKVGKYAFKALSLPGVGLAINGFCGWMETKTNPEGVKNIFRPGDPAPLTESEANSFIFASAMAGADLFNKETWSKDFWSFEGGGGAILDTVGTVAEWATIGTFIGGPVGTVIGGVVGLGLACIGTPRLAKWTESVKSWWRGDVKAKPQSKQPDFVPKTQPYQNVTNIQGPQSLPIEQRNHNPNDIEMQPFPQLAIPERGGGGDQGFDAASVAAGLGLGAGAGNTSQAGNALGAIGMAGGIDEAGGAGGAGGTGSGGGGAGQLQTFPNSFMAYPGYVRPEVITRFYNDIRSISALRQMNEQIRGKEYSYEDLKRAEEELHYLESALASPNLVEARLIETESQLIVELVQKVKQQLAQDGNSVDGIAQLEIDEIQKMTFWLDKLLDDMPRYQMDIEIPPPSNLNNNRFDRATAAANSWADEAMSDTLYNINNQNNLITTF